MTLTPVQLQKEALPVSGTARLSLARTADALWRGAVDVLVLAAVALLVLPLVIVLSMSFDARDYLGAFPPPALSLRWYARFFSDSYLLAGLKTSLVLACAAAVAATLLGLSAAVAIDRLPPRWRDAVSSLFLAPLIIPGVVVGFALLLLYGRLGIDDAFLRLLGGHIVVTLPYALRAMLAALGNVRPSLVEAALSLGANERRAFWSVTFPLVRAGILAGAIFAFAFSLDDVAASIFLTDPQAYTLPVALVSMLHANFDLTIAAVAVIYIAFASLLMILLDRTVGLDRIVGRGLFAT